MKKTASVLIVDDEPSIRLMFRTALESSGYETLEAGDGSAALRSLDEFAPDVVLLDLKMPVMGGMEVLQQMRDAGHDATVVIVTAHGSIPDAVAAMKLGAVDFLAKPITPDMLRRVVGDCVARHGTPRPTADHDPGALSPHRRDERIARERLRAPQDSGGAPAVVVELMHPVVDLSPVKRR